MRSKLVPLGLIGFGLLMLIVSIGSHFKDRASADWPATQAVVLSAKVEEQRGHVPGRRLGNSPGREELVSHEPMIEYEYEVAGKTYRSNRWSYGGQSKTSEESASALVARHKPGTKVVVRYNPADPEEAVLETGGAAWLMSIPAIVFIGAGGWLLRGRRRQPERDAEQEQPGD